MRMIERGVFRRLVPGAAVAIALVGGCVQASPDDEYDFGDAAPVASAAAPSVAAPQPQDPRTRIDGNVFEPYRKADYPKLAAKLGGGWVRVQPLREAAAFKALESPRCRNVDTSDVSVDKSTRGDLFAFVYCNNGSERFNFSEASVISAGAPLANSEKTISRAAAIKACSEAAKSETMYPTLADMHTWAGASYQTYAPLGSARVLLNFEATNALGVKLPYLADCMFPVDQPPEITITTR